jgi:hypothetical protein
MHAPFPVSTIEGQQGDFMSAVPGIFLSPGGVGTGMKRLDQTDLHSKRSMAGTILVGSKRIDKEDMVL